MPYISVAKKKSKFICWQRIFTLFDVLVTLDFVKEHNTSYKGVINISKGDWSTHNIDIQNKLNELTEADYIIFAAVGNDGDNNCQAIEKIL